jgi:hypothetical protein
MMFQDEHHLTVDGLPGPDLWKALLKDALDGKTEHAGYSYVYVHAQRAAEAHALAQRQRRSSPRPATPACPPRRPSSARSRSSSTSP